MVQPLTYEALKNIAITDPTVQDNLEDLKYMFRSEIGSARNMYRIHTIADLFDCLERHDALSEYKIEPLREIADEFSGSLGEVIIFYKVPMELRAAQPYNEYREIRLAHECATRLNIGGNTNSSGSGLNVNCSQTLINGNKTEPVFAQLLTNEKRAAIYKLIAGEIGTAWRWLGRELDIGQGAMDNIEMQYQDLNTRVYKLFQAFEKNEANDPEKHLLIICRALDECRRKDLRRKIERIMSH